MAKAKATKSSSPLLASIPKRGRDAIARIMENQGGSLALAELLARNWDYETLFGGSLDPRRVKEMAAELAQQRDCTLEQALATLPFLFLTADLREVAIARRFTLDDPAELGRGLAVLSRLRWVQGMLKNQPTASGESVLEALAVRDTEAAMRLAAGNPLVSQAADGEELEFLDLMTLAVLGACRGDESALGDAVRRMMRGRKWRPWQQGVQQCLAGLADHSPTDVVGGLTGFLDGLRLMRQKDDLEEAVSLTAHGLYRLCERVNPALVAGFDIAQSLPWDAGFHAWTIAHPDPLAGLDLARVSPALQDAVVGLNPPTKPG